MPTDTSDRQLTVQGIAQSHPEAVGSGRRFDLVRLPEAEAEEGARVIGTQLYPDRSEHATEGSVVAVGRDDQSGEVVTLPGETPIVSYEPV